MFSTMNSKQAQNQSQQLIYKRLAALDFDDTIIDDNSNVVIRDIIDPLLIPVHIRRLYKTVGWMRYMQGIFRLFHENGVGQNEIHRKIEDIKPVKGLIKLIKTLNCAYNYDVIIISDSNSDFISHWLKSNGLLGNIKRIFTNPASYDETGRLEIKPFHHQIDCHLSATNLCKGQILEQFLQEQLNRQKPVVYETICYIGDGNNDVCPILKLSRFDFGCVRLNYRLDKVIEMVSERQKVATDRLQAKIIRWTDGDDLLKKILNVTQESINKPRLNSIDLIGRLRVRKRKDILL